MSLPSLLDPAPLGRTAAVSGCGVTSRSRPPRDRRPAANGSRSRGPTRALDEDVDLAYAMPLGLARGVLGGQLRGERRRLTRFETDMAGGGPGDDVALRVGDGHDRVVERALDVGGAVRDVLLSLRRVVLPFLPDAAFFGGAMVT